MAANHYIINSTLIVPMEHSSHSIMHSGAGVMDAPAPALVFPESLFILLHLSLLAIVGLLLLS
jgi:hypothetical protein